MPKTQGEAGSRQGQFTVGLSSPAPWLSSTGFTLKKSTRCLVHRQTHGLSSGLCPQQAFLNFCSEGTMNACLG